MSAQKTTVLMYHALTEKWEQGVNSIHIGVEMFEQQMAWLNAQNYESITVTELYQRLSKRLPIVNTIVITFDDGYLSLLHKASPILKKYGLVATLFLTTDFVGMPKYALKGDFIRGLPLADRPLTWDELSEMQSDGWDIQAHSCTHRAHDKLIDEQLVMEMEGSRHFINKHLKQNSEFYAFPFGNYNKNVLDKLIKANYLAGFSVHGGQVSSASDLRRLPRNEINTECAVHVFAKLVRLGYRSNVDKYRSRLRNMLFHYPLIKDIIKKVMT